MHCHKYHRPYTGLFDHLDIVDIYSVLLNETKFYVVVKVRNRKLPDAEKPFSTVEQVTLNEQSAPVKEYLTLNQGIINIIGLFTSAWSASTE